MEIARVLLEKYLANKSQLEVNDAREKSLLLAEIFRRFGDCESFKENFTKAKEEFLKSIKILEEIEDKETSRRLSSNYYLIGITVNHEAKVGHAKEAKIYIEKAIAIMENVSKKDDMDEVTKKEVSSLLSMMKQKRDDLKEEIETTNPADPDAIKKAISQTKFNTSTSFPKSQLKDVKVNKLGVFGKGKETMSKKLKEPATLITREEISKPIKKVQTETPKETS
jgi:tetratricopeptide (TPR) repeat protein